MSGTEQLALLEQDVDRLRISMFVDVADAFAELLAADSVRRQVGMLNEWSTEFPRATSQLLRLVARDSTASSKLAAAMLACQLIDREDADDILNAAFPTLSGVLREAALSRDELRRRLGIEENPRTAVRVPDPAWRWPTGKPFPAADTVEGVQARLNYLDLGAGPVNGEWTELTRRAFVRWQVLNGFEPTGELDWIAAEDLRLMTPDAPE